MPFDYQQHLYELRQSLRVDFAGIAMPSDLAVQDDIRWLHVSGADNERYQRIHLQRGKGIAGSVMKSGRAWLEHHIDAHTFPDDRFNYPIIRSEKLTSFIAVPLWKYNRVAGVLLLGNRENRPLADNIQQLVDLNLAAGFGPFYGEDVFNCGQPG
ncbi:GAF domain-containing protein [Macrococcus hajekii]|uniref:GAF domain-containing protein n=1 Tax=Macrococcus hajekii TaxID=198482 RepID=A0A4V3BEB8_9STAP|nr:GAF domain-containing protein [Macrococcus hajekii]TDM01904.1 GAF domain-containing protein [Macrococcus hajekii]GGB08426.1 GAF domain-containing protein [Macrococcus hajekii]